MEYTLQNEELCVGLTTNGGTLCSIKDAAGMEYLWQGDTAYWSGQAPVLFPICGSIREDKGITMDGRRLKMPRHGIVRKEEFRVEEAGSRKICFSIENTEIMLAQFPYRFKLYTTYELEGKSLRITYTVENKEQVRMPFFIGGHPGFRCPLSEGEVYSDYQVVFEQEENCTVPFPVTETGLIDMEQRTKQLVNTDKLQLSHSLFHKDAIIFDELKSRKIKIKHQQKEKGVELDFQQFPYLILWSTANDGPFVAVEPWSGLSTCSDEDNLFEHKRGVSFAEPGEAKKFTYRITVL